MGWRQHALPNLERLLVQGERYVFSIEAIQYTGVDYVGAVSQRGIPEGRAALITELMSP